MIVHILDNFDYYQMISKAQTKLKLCHFFNKKYKRTWLPLNNSLDGISIIITKTMIDTINTIKKHGKYPNKKGEQPAANEKKSQVIDLMICWGQNIIFITNIYLENRMVQLCY